MKTLKQLIEGLPAQTTGSLDVAIEDVVFDSRQVRPGSLFVALQGTRADGRRFIADAIAAGARAILLESTQSATDVPNRVTQVIVPNALQALAQVAVRFWDAPSQKLLM